MDADLLRKITARLRGLLGGVDNNIRVAPAAAAGCEPNQFRPQLAPSKLCASCASEKKM